MKQWGDFEEGLFGLPVEVYVVAVRETSGGEKVESERSNVIVTKSIVGG